MGNITYGNSDSILKFANELGQFSNDLEVMSKQLMQRHAAMSSDFKGPQYINLSNVIGEFNKKIIDSKRKLEELSSYTRTVGNKLAEVESNIIK